jgi:flagellin
MTRINTNVSSLNAQKTLAKNQQSLNTAMTRLSTGLRINSGADDPSGMIAAAIQSNDIAAMKQAITNTQNGSMLIGTADSALGQITNLLTDIRGLVTQVGNTAVVNSDMINANQLQVDSALQAIDRISQVTKFQGQSILDGSLDFVNSAQSVPQITNLHIDTANLGTTGQMEVAVAVAAHAERANITSSSGEQNASTTVQFAARVEVTVDATADGAMAIVANSNSSEYAGVTAVFTANAGATTTALYNADTKRLEVSFHAAATVADLTTAIEGTGLFTVESLATIAGPVVAVTTGTLAQNSFTLTADNKGTDYNDVKVKFASSATVTAANPGISWNAATKELTITLLNTDLYASGSTTAQVVAAINADVTASAIFTASGGTANDRVWGFMASDNKAIASTGSTGYLRSAFSDSTRAQATVTLAAGAKFYGGTGGGMEMAIKATSLNGTQSDVAVTIQDDATVTKGNEYAEYDAAAKKLTVHIHEGALAGATGSTMTQIATAINNSRDASGNITGAWTAVLLTADTGNSAVAGAAPVNFSTSQDTITVESLNAGANFNNMQVKFETVSAAPAAGATASYDATNNVFKIQVKYTDAATEQVTLQQISNAISAVSGFAGSYSTKNASAGTNQSAGVVFGKSVDTSVVGNTNSSGGNVLIGHLTLEVGSNEGQQVFTWKAGTGANEVAAAINAVSDAIGVVATYNNDLINFKSSLYGVKGFVSLNVISEGAIGQFKSGVSSFRETGTDADATINGIQTSSDGNSLSINTSSLAMTVDLLAETNGSFNFSITGGGAQFQLGPDVVSNQQLRIGIQSVNTSRLGGVSGRLYQLASGNDADLSANPNLAAKIVNEAGTAVTTLRGRLGAIQGLTMQTNQATLEDMVQNMETSLSLIQDTDFAAETANLTRAQILSQANMSVLSIANQQPQQVLSLLPR